MPKFLERTAEYLLQHQGDNISQVCVVLPNRRAGLFLKKYLAEQVKKTIWAPAIFSIEDFMTEISRLRMCDATETLFELYEVYRALEGEKAQEFDEFVHWGQQLIGDFNEIDSYLVDSGDLFSFLNEAKALTIWNLENTPLTEFEKQYLHFFNSLNRYHELLSERLLKEGLAYAGLLFRKTSEMLPSMIADLPWKNVVFAGFNAMTRAEETVVDLLVQSGKGELLWDSDAYYLEDDTQEAGYFLRKWKRKWTRVPFQWTENCFAASPKSIKITGVPLHIGQAKYCGELIRELTSGNDHPEDTAVVMMDEQLLIPLLNSLPDNITELNITMGLPLRQTPLYDLLEAIFGMHLNLRGFSAGVAGSGKFYYRDVLKVLQHPYILGIAGTLSEGSPFSIEELIKSIRLGTRIFLGKEMLYSSSAGLFSQNLNFLDPLFNSWQTIGEAMTNLSAFLGVMQEGLIRKNKEEKKNGNVLELEYLFAFSKIVFRLSALTEKYGTVSNLQTLFSLFKQISGSTSLPFYGEPLRGVQVMGMLETRTLDFKNIILLSANEDLLPAGKTTQSFIPYDIRRQFQLPTYKSKHSVSAYHFYRLLQRASTVHCMYNTEPDELGGGEKSRFIKQIVHELRDYNPGITIREEILATHPETGRMRPVLSVPKTGDVLDKLNKKALSGMSATSINNWLLCPLKFYFRDLLGLEEPKEMKETIDAQVLGSSVHKALEILYSPYKNNYLDTAAIGKMLQNMEDAIDKAFHDEYQGSDLAYGKNLLIVRVAKIMLRRFLQFEIRNLDEHAKMGARVKLLDLEKFVQRSLEIPVENGKLTVKMKGFIDRIDRVGDSLQIIDYKTGKVNPADLVLSDWQDLQDNPETGKILQLLIYAWFMSGDIERGISPGIISLRKINEEFMSVTLPEEENQQGRITQADLTIFEKILAEILVSVFDPSLPFSQTEDPSRCQYCDFITLCGR
jgi:ATP-dependent helicase/nuclease subunit B